MIQLYTSAQPQDPAHQCAVFFEGLAAFSRHGASSPFFCVLSAILSTVFFFLQFTDSSSLLACGGGETLSKTNHPIRLFSGYTRAGRSVTRLSQKSLGQDRWRALPANGTLKVPMLRLQFCVFRGECACISHQKPRAQFSAICFIDAFRSRSFVPSSALRENSSAVMASGSRVVAAS
ncbi:hypothetical protein BDZ88DRAFT_103674 [Geranomyces variabilis]|nr:hypothetical protein BDZ88DRAFT_103674 [Geranomyces variabilis]